jgi:hypothetical protein
VRHPLRPAIRMYKDKYLSAGDGLRGEAGAPNSTASELTKLDMGRTSIRIHPLDSPALVCGIPSS